MIRLRAVNDTFTSAKEYVYASQTNCLRQKDFSLKFDNIIKNTIFAPSQKHYNPAI